MARPPLVVPDDLFGDEDLPGSRAAADQVSDWARPGSAKRRARPKVKDSEREAARERVRVMLASREWDSTRGLELVELYAWCHQQVYGVAATDLDAYEALQAQRMAGAFIARECSGEPARAVEFVRWAWGRERVREQRRRALAGDDGYRLGWRLVFGNKLIVDWRLAMARKDG